MDRYDSTNGADWPDPGEPAWEDETRQPPLAARIRWPMVALGGVIGLLVFVGCGTVVLLLMFRDPLPELRWEDLQAAQQRWDAHGPADYDLALKLGGATPGVVRLQVRDGQPVHMARDGQRPPQRRTWHAWTVPGQFDMIVRELEMAENPQREMQAEAHTQLLLGAEFDPELGYPLRFRRLVIGQGPEVSWAVTSFRAVGGKSDD